MSNLYSSAKAFVFDAYGTLFDVHSAVAAHADQLGDQSSAISQTWRNKQLQYTWLRSLMGEYRDFWQVTGDALRYAMAFHRVTDPVLEKKLLDAYLELSCYNEVPETLRRMKEDGKKTAILSNGSPAMLQAAVENAAIADCLDACLSVDDLQIYKPHPSVYRLAVDALGVTAGEISFQSSNAWDAVGATAFGFRVAWINRFEQPAEELQIQPEFEIHTLDQLLRL